MTESSPSELPRGAALYLAVVQFFFVTTWTIEVLIAGQLIAGGAWGCIMMAGFSAALAFGRTGREGTALGLLFGMLAVATLSRMGAVAAQLNKIPDYAVWLTWGPVTLWLAGAVVFLGLAATRQMRETT